MKGPYSKLVERIEAAAARRTPQAHPVAVWVKPGDDLAALKAEKAASFYATNPQLAGHPIEWHEYSWNWSGDAAPPPVTRAGAL